MDSKIWALIPISIKHMSLWCVFLLEPYIECPYPCPCPCPPIPMGFGWAWVGIGFVYPCIQLQIGVKLLICREYANQEVLRAEAKTMNDLLFVRSNQNLVYACNTHYTIFEYMGAIWIAWVGMGGLRSLLMGMVWVWVQFRRKVLGSVSYIQSTKYNCPRF